VAQRNTSVTGITTTGYYTADRWRIAISSAGTWTMNVESSAPTNTEFRNSSNLICTTADSSLSAGDNFTFQQRFEGQNLQSIKKGTPAAESLTVSFWVKSSNTGTYICEFFDDDNSRQISKSYTIDAANTWEKKTITVPPDTTGLLDNDNANSLQLNFWLAAGTTFSSGTLNSSAWASNTNANRAVNQLNLANAVGNYWAVTGIQLETGTVATPFEVRNIAQELALCQRYYAKLNAGSGTFAYFGMGFATSATELRVFLKYPQTMRASPTINQSSCGANDGSIFAITSVGTAWTGTDTAQQIFTVASGLTSNRPTAIGANDSTSAFVDFSAEL
jgi:hypothetical protein